MSQFLFDRSQSKARDVNQKSNLLLKLKNIYFCYFQWSYGHIHSVVSKLVNVVKLQVENNNIASTLSSIVHINVRIDDVDLTLLDAVSFNVNIQSVARTLI